MSKKLFSFKIEDELYNELKKYSENKHISMSNILNIALKNYFKFMEINKNLKENDYKIEISTFKDNKSIIQITYFIDELNEKNLKDICYDFDSIVKK